MTAFLVKITNRENVDHVLNMQEFIHEDIYNFESEIVSESYVFIVFSGDKSKIDWEQGLIGFGKITQAPYEKGYSTSNPRYFRIKIKPIFVLPHPLEPKFTKLHPIYQSELYDVPYVGANHFPNQAIAKTGDIGANALFNLFLDIAPECREFQPLLEIKITPSWLLFESFLENHLPPFSEKTISNYKSGVRSLCSWYSLTTDQLISKSCDELKNILSKVTSDPRDISGKRMYSNGLKQVVDFINSISNGLNSTKIEIKDHSTHPFLILAGISGTGKSRFVREQAEKSCPSNLRDAKGKPNNFCLVPVRPDWHEPSDLLGYVSRISGTAEFIPTKFTGFLIKSWLHVFQSGGDLNSVDPQTAPFWLCLDEMNLAPVEQYFADYLSILETRKWDGDVYSCDALIDFKSIQKDLIQKAYLGLLKEEEQREIQEDQKWKDMWDAFGDVGIPLPPNLIVAGTVNMDETTHGFSRKVLDRALSLDFNEFYPNKFDQFFEDEKVQQPKTLTFSTTTQVTREDLSPTVDTDGSLTRKFIQEINEILAGTPFELAYRALNQALMLVAMWGQKSADWDEKVHLAAIWDDFLMMKVLPRIEGDHQKLGEGEDCVLLKLQNLLKDEFLKDIWHKDWDGKTAQNPSRPDLLQEDVKSTTEKPIAAPEIPCRSQKKIAWMIKRLERGYTSFWA